MIQTAKSLHLYEYCQEGEIPRVEYFDGYDGDVLCIDEELTLNVAFFDFIRTAKTIVQRNCVKPNVRAVGDCHNGYRIMAITEGNLRLMVQISWDSDGDIDIAERSVIKIAVSGDPGLAIRVLKDFRETYPTKLARVRWYFMAGDHLNQHDVVLQEPSPIAPEYYPFIDPNATDYMNAFLDHPASLLFLSGPPGTGKTTLLRNFLYEHKLRGVVTYEDTLLTSDQMFVDFVTSKNHDVMIIEDADVMLGSREHQGNKMIARFLNASDGIIQLHKKKMIFTTNLESFKDVDPALIRPGRSFGAVEFRNLTPKEADAAAKVAQIKNWKTPDHDIPLSEVFNDPNQSSWGKRAVGFRA